LANGQKPSLIQLMNNQKKLLAIIPTGFCFGLQHVTIDLLNATKNELDTHFLVSNWSNGDFEKLLNKSGFTYSYSWLGMFSRKTDWHNLKMSMVALIKLPLLYWHFIGLLRSKKPHILFFANHHELILLLPVLWFVRTPVVCHMHDPAPAIPFQQKTFSCYGKRVNLFIAISNDVKRRIILLGCASDKIKVVHNGIFLPKAISGNRNNDFIISAKWAEDVFIIGISGQMTETKGHEDLLDAFEIAYLQNKKLRLVLGGKQLEPMYFKLKEQIKAKRLENVVFFSGWLANASLFYKSIDVFVLASRHDEGFGLVVAEAMANLRPVIITRSGGAAEIVENGKSGIIVEKKDTAAMALAMLRYASDIKFYKFIQQKARVRIEDYFNINKAAISFSAALDQVSLKFK
jgi:glycosyltransferase involved in cell wall biosynthesis